MPAHLSQWRARIARRKQANKNLQHFAQECTGEWRDFAQQPGTHLRLVPTGITRRELRTGERQTVARLRRVRYTTVTAGGRTFTWEQVAASSRPDIAEIIRRSHPNHDTGYFTSNTQPNRVDQLNLRAVANETGVPILYTSGYNFNGSAGARITFPDRRWLEFPVRGTGRANAIMTAVDQDGNKVARYRLTGKLRAFSALPMEITVQPGHPLTDELVLAIVISAGWLGSYFSPPEGGGG